MAQGQTVQGNADDQQEKPRHNDLGKLFNALFHAAVDHKGGNSQKHQHKEDGGSLGGNEGCEEAISRGGGPGSGQINCGIFENPAADDRVVGHDQGRYQEGHVAQEFPLGPDRTKGMEGAGLGSSADGHIGGEQGKAEGQHQHQIGQQEDAAAVLGGEIGKPPDVANTNGASGGGQYKADGAGEAAFLFAFIGVPPEKRDYSTNIYYSGQYKKCKRTGKNL